MKTESLYLHIPFCDHICSYCDFPKQLYRRALVDDYLAALKRELSSLPQQIMKTIYIGGGTPSCLNERQLTCLLEMVKPFVGAYTLEYTVEVNPESMNGDKLQMLAASGVSRLSIGVQTFQEHLLPYIERQHTAREAMALIESAHQAGIRSVSIDLMYGLPKQTLRDVTRDLDVVSRLAIDHVSYYALILEHHTKLNNMKYEGLDEDEEADWNDYIDARLLSMGYHLYEVSNYAKGDHESWHNKAYWHYDNYYGVGVGAAGKVDDCLYVHGRSLRRYIAGENIVSKEHLSLSDTMFNHVMMSLRLCEGLSLEEFKRRYHQDVRVTYAKAIDKHMSLGNLVIEKGFLKTTPASLRYLNDILCDFL